MTAPQTPWINGCWDIVFTDDRANNRPDPYLGQLQPPAAPNPPTVPGTLGTNKYGVYGLLPLTWDVLVSPTSDVNAFPLPQTPATSGSNVPFGANYFTVIGNNIADFPSPGSGKTEFSPPNLVAPNGFTVAQAWDPFDFNVTASPLTTISGTPTPTLPAGVLPVPTNGVVNTTYPSTVSGVPITPPNPPVALPAGTGQFFWVCLRRPANPFAPVSPVQPHDRRR